METIKMLKAEKIFLLIMILFIFAYSCQKPTETEQLSLSDVKILNPSKGEQFYGGNLDTIKWSYPGIIEKVSLYYSTDNGASWVNIIKNANIPSGEYIWEVPNVSSDNAKIKLTVMSKNNRLNIFQDIVFLKSLFLIEILKPANGEIYYSISVDTIKWSDPEIIEKVNLYYTTDNGVSWVNIIENVNIQSGEYIWEVPNVSSNNAKIKLTAVSKNNRQNIFQSFVIQNGLILTEPKSLDVYYNPENITIRWQSHSNFTTYELFYSKFNVNRSSNWNLIADNIDGTRNEYNWSDPNIYSNEVKLKLVAVNSIGLIEEYSDTVFTIDCDSVLFKERQYHWKLGISNKWIYYITKDNVWTNSEEEYYFVQEVIDSKIEDGIKYYNLLQKTLDNSIKITNSWVADRVYYSPTVVMQNGDSYNLGTVGDYNFWKSCKEYVETVFNTQQKIKEYKTGDAYSNSSKKYAKDLGRYYYNKMVEGNMTKSILKGAYIDGVVYGDTSVIGL